MFSNRKLNHNFLILSVFISTLFLFSSPVNAETTCTSPFVPVSPALTDLGNGEYLRLTSINPSTFTPTGFTGGLYPNGSNVRPPELEAAALAISSTIQPLDSEGNPSATGRIGFGSIGMSNTSSNFGRFMGSFVNPPIRTIANDKLKTVNTASGGSTIDRWVETTNPFYQMVWDYTYQLLSYANTTPEQMQVFWVKVTRAGYFPNFPEDMNKLTDDYVLLMHELHNRFPNLKIVYMSSRTRSYGIFSALSPETTAYENGFAVKWLIERQLNGDPELNYDPSRGEVKAPLIVWGPYLWIDGENQRSDGKVWLASDLASDCVHPSPSGSLKAAQMLWDFFTTDSTTRSWFLDPGIPAPTNQPPVVNVGPDVTTPLSQTLVMHATVADDGLPTGSQVVNTWTVDNGPGNVSMTDWNNKDTNITFDTEGTYQLTLTATDSVFEASDQLTVTVVPDPVNEAPVAVDSTHTTDSDTQISFALPFTDPNPGDSHTFDILEGPASGELSEVDGTVTYTPDGTTLGEVSFTWTVSDIEYTSNVATATITITEAPDIDPNLLTYFDFYETGPLVDLVNTCSGCAINGATWTNAGKLNGGYVFDGVNDTLSLGTFPYLSGRNAFTYALWVKPNFTNTATSTHFVANNFGQFALQYLGPINDWRATVKINTSNINVDTVGATWNAETWHLLTVTYDGAVVRMYMDGIGYGTKNISGNVINTSSSTILGGYVGQNVYFNGVMDEVKVYNRALSPTEVMDLFVNP